jgi:hypothetical protein
MKLIPNARKAPRMLSVQAFVAIGVLHTAWLASPEVHALLPVAWVQGITLALTVLGVLGRLVDQPGAK